MERFDSKKAFSGKVDEYAKYRPTYPPAAIDFFKQKLGLKSSCAVADVGSGTGLFTELLLKNGCFVYAVEPNQEMRRTAERLLGKCPNFKSVNGNAESTGLADASVDFVTAAQAFHWFDVEKSKAELSRVLRPGGFAVLIWNERKRYGNAFQKAFSGFLTLLAQKFRRVHPGGFFENTDEGKISSFFSHSGFSKEKFENFQELGFDGLLGLVASRSYSPKQGTNEYNDMKGELQAMFNAHAKKGLVQVAYETEVYWGKLG